MGQESCVACSGPKSQAPRPSTGTQGASIGTRGASSVTHVEAEQIVAACKAGVVDVDAERALVDADLKGEPDAAGLLDPVDVPAGSTGSTGS